MTAIIETKRLIFNRLSYTYVSGYKVYTSYNGEPEQFLTYIENPLTTNLEEHLESNATIKEGYINLPKGAHHDVAFPPKVILNDELLTDLDYSYSPYLKQVKLSSHIKPNENDIADLIYYKDSIVYGHYVEHMDGINPVKYRVEPVYRNTHLIGNHTKI